MTSVANFFALCSNDPNKTKLSLDQLAKCEVILERLVEIDGNMVSKLQSQSSPAASTVDVACPKVFIRVRPCNQTEMAEGNGVLSGLNTDLSSAGSTTGACELQVTGPATGCTKLDGFDGIFGEEVLNDSVFTHTISPHIKDVLAGSSTQLFCYGHTGTGKTHTMMGYGPQVGLFRQAAESLLADIAKLNSGRTDPEDRFLLQVTFAEVYLDRVFDLVGGRQECSLREDASGGLHIRAATDKRVDGAVYVGRQRRAVADNIEDIMTVLHEGIALRAVGSSSLHDQSSRSHAVMRMEVVSARLLTARAAVEDAEAHVHPVGKEKTDVGIAFCMSLLQIGPAPEGGDETKTRYSATRKCDSGEMSADEWMELLEELFERYARLNLELAAALTAQAEAEAVEAAILGTSTEIVLGGSLTLVDLAGELYHRTI